MLLIKASTVNCLLKQVNAYLHDIGSLGYYGVSAGFILYYYSGRYFGNIVNVLELRKKNGFYTWFHNNRIDDVEKIFGFVSFDNYEKLKKYV